MTGSLFCLQDTKRSLGVGLNILYFRHCLGKIPILTHIFQMGWNHQPDQHWIWWSILFTCCHWIQYQFPWNMLFLELFASIIEDLGKTGRQQLHYCWTKFPDSLCIRIYIYWLYKQPFKLRFFVYHFETGTSETVPGILWVLLYLLVRWNGSSKICVSAWAVGLAV